MRSGVRSRIQKIASRPGWIRLLNLRPSRCRSHWRVDLIPVPGIILVILMIGLDLAVRGIERQHRARIEVVARVDRARPWRGIADAPVDGLGVLVIVTGHPRRAAA